MASPTIKLMVGFFIDTCTYGGLMLSRRIVQEDVMAEIVYSQFRIHLNDYLLKAERGEAVVITRKPPSSKKYLPCAVLISVKEHERLKALDK